MTTFTHDAARPVAFEDVCGLRTNFTYDAVADRREPGAADKTVDTADLPVIVQVDGARLVAE